MSTLAFLAAVLWAFRGAFDLCSGSAAFLAPLLTGRARHQV